MKKYEKEYIKTKIYKADGMSCMHYINNIETNFGTMECVSEVKVSLDDATMTLKYNEEKVSEEAIAFSSVFVTMGLLNNTI